MIPSICKSFGANLFVLLLCYLIAVPGHWPVAKNKKTTMFLENNPKIG